MSTTFGKCLDEHISMICICFQQGLLLQLWILEKYGKSNGKFHNDKQIASMTFIWFCEGLIQNPFIISNIYTNTYTQTTQYSCYIIWMVIWWYMYLFRVGFNKCKH